MRWTWVLLMAGFGIVIGLLNLTGWTEGREWYLWIVVALISSLVLALKVGGKYFKHGLVSALIAAAVNTLLIYVFFDEYLANSAKLQEAVKQVPEGFDMRNLMLISAPFTIAISGVVQGALTLLMGKLLGEKPAPPVPPPDNPAPPVP
ncbi:hypothetical protein HZB60_10700 [candidate division KSB1 bacterium]|nr:hypothetical protein [candidate division KSB1 bacterium]